jgi:hypothetical protein
VDILRAFLLDLRSQFRLEVYGITGNESRAGKELGWSDELATDSYDLMIYAILRRGFCGARGKDANGASRKGAKSNDIQFCGFQANELLFHLAGSGSEFVPPSCELLVDQHGIGQSVRPAVAREGRRGDELDRDAPRRSR